MIRRIIEIDQEKCNGCGACAEACHEGAIGMIDGKATLLRDDYCDGLGDCLPTCPTGAIAFVEREAAEYDEAAVQENMKKREQDKKQMSNAHHGGGCPGSKIREMNRRNGNEEAKAAPAQNAPVMESQLRQWPVQIKLVPIKAPFFDGSHLLIAADCTAYAYANFHQDFIRGKVTVVGCPKLDAVDYSEKLQAIISQNDIKQVTIVRMEVPCCGGLEQAAITAMKNSGKFLPWQVVTIGIDGTILE